MAVRFTNDILSTQTLFNLNNITDALAKTQNEMSTGKRISTPEDAPSTERGWEACRSGRSGWLSITSCATHWVERSTCRTRKRIP